MATRKVKIVKAIVTITTHEVKSEKNRPAVTIDDYEPQSQQMSEKARGLQPPGFAGELP